MDDKSTNQISIKKFQEVYNAIVADSPNIDRGDGKVISKSTY